MTSSVRPLVALISATPAAIPPAMAAFERTFPSATLWNLLDDRLLAEADERGGLDDELRGRMKGLIDYAEAGGANGILLTCSMYGPVAHDHVEGGAYVLAPDDAAFGLIADLAPASILVVASLPNPLRDSCHRLRAALEARGVSTKVVGALAEGAFEAVAEGDTARLVESIRAAVEAHDGAAGHPVFLAQYSLTPAAEILTAQYGFDLITGPDAAAKFLQGHLAGSVSAG